MRILPTLFLGSALLCGGAAAAARPTDQDAAEKPAASVVDKAFDKASDKAADKPVRELDPVHVNAMRNPEVRKYQVILAGLDAFDDFHRMAPKADRLHFRLEPRGKDDSVAPALAVRLVGDDGFKLPLPLGADGRFTVPRSEEAEDANSELELNRKRKLYRIAADVRTPGLAPNQRRLGDLRLECRVMVAMAKEEIPFLVKALVNSLLLTTDWCSYFDDKKNATFGFRADKPLAEAVLVEGNRSALLRSSGRGYSVPLGDSAWNDDAVIELTYAEVQDAPRTATAAGTADDATPVTP